MGRLDQRDRVRVHPQLLREEAEPMQGIDVPRFGLQDLPVDPLRLGQPARLLVVQGGLERLLGGHVRWVLPSSLAE
jgi:hypothetical protein